ncbi:phosphoribosylanthranilate isomerase [Oligoflexus tunisiensis]|uniref:phosphoribosylanthranilate isomerase n=1 Tax=Oligoflexus tunisiensis TaxID=708132 RepID=UPI000AE09475|nr:phosphoribosylanthranilate isomerase [Oligoflexus tunisiensis]
MRIKICGITRTEDARLALQLGAWALGFIFHEKSPRYITAAAVRRILDDLAAEGLVPERKVGVFVNATTDHIHNTLAISGLDTVQLHGDETPAFCQSLSGTRLWKAFRLRSSDQLLELPAFEPTIEAFLFDAAVAGQYGGTGHTTDWSLVASIQSSRPLILSGGLHPENLQAAAAAVPAFAFDLSSGVEVSPGIKNADKLRKLFQLRNPHGSKP